MTKEYTLQAKIWMYPGKAGWHFVTIPPKIASDIDYHFNHVKRGWGSLRVRAAIGMTVWETSIFPDKSTQSYLLPLKIAVREKEELKNGDSVAIRLSLTD